MGVGVPVGVAVGLGDGFGVGLGAGFDVGGAGFGVAVGPGFGVPVGPGSGVAVTLGVDVAVGVSVGLGVGVSVMVNAIDVADEPRRGVQLRLETDPKLPDLRADPERLRQVFINLGDNALKFTPSGGSVTYKASAVEQRGGGRVVRDQGSGVSRQDPDLTPDP